MSLYVCKTSYETSDDRTRNPRRIRRSPIADSVINDDKDLKTTSDLSDKGRFPSATSDSKTSARNRKSKLIESMAANFEKTSPADTRSLSPAASRSARNPGSIPTIKTDPPPDDDPPPKQSYKKGGASARKGKLQREKRMLRQKRRSTGVVNPEDIEESEKKDPEDHTEAEIELKKETAVNTQTNELSPASALCPPSRSPPAKTEAPPSSTRSNVASPAKSPPRPDRMADYASSLPGNHDQDAQVRLNAAEARLEAAEATIAKLRKEIEDMDDELCELEKENKEVKRNNKLLEDENRTLLLFIKK